MSSSYHRALKLSLFIHLGLLVLLIFGPLLSRCTRGKKPKDEITFVELVQPVSPPPRPEPTPPDPAPAPEPPPPEPEPEPIVEPPPKPKPKPKPKIQVNTNKIVRREAPKPPPQAPALTAEQIRQQLLQGLPGTTPTTPSSANASVLGSYLAVVQNALYAAWQKPGGVAGRRVTVQIRIARDGSMIQRKLVGSSGDATLDESVMTALQSVRKFSAIPASYTDPFLDVTIHFESTGVSL